MDVSVLRVCVWFFSVLQAAHFARFDEFLRGAVCAAVLGKAHIVDIKTSTASLFGVFPIIHPTNIRFRGARTGRCLTAYAQHARNAKKSIAYDRPSLFISAIVAIFYTRTECGHHMRNWWLNFSNLASVGWRWVALNYYARACFSYLVSSHCQIASMELQWHWSPNWTFKIINRRRANASAIDIINLFGITSARLTTDKLHKIGPWNDELSTRKARCKQFHSMNVWLGYVGSQLAGKQ